MKDFLSVKNYMMVCIIIANTTKNAASEESAYV